MRRKENIWQLISHRFQTIQTIHENPDLPTLIRKLVYRKRQNDVVFSDDQVELKNQIEALGDR